MRAPACVRARDLSFYACVRARGCVRVRKSPLLKKKNKKFSLFSRGLRGRGYRRGSGPVDYVSGSPPTPIYFL